MNLRGNPAGAEVVLICDDLDVALAFYMDELGFRLDMIMPADAPRVAIVSGFGISLRLKLRSALDDDIAPDGTLAAPANIAIERVGEQCLDVAMPAIETPIIKRAEGEAEWIAGRAGMHYRDLIPDRIGGRVIASQIRIEQGGPVGDYVHYHKVGLQLIYCRRGWVRVVYEDQGPSFVMQPGDCVLQPPTIRHRVLESSAGLEVIELGIPAEHETWRDHDLSLPTEAINPQRDFGGQRYVHHIASTTAWQVGADNAVAIRDMEIDAATNQMASARVLELRGTVDAPVTFAMPQSAFRFLFVLDGSVQLLLSSELPVTLSTDDACVVPTNHACSLHGNRGAQLLDICIRVA